MNYCEGYYEPNNTVTRQEHPSENVTHCSNRTALFHFDPTAIIESELAPGLNLTDLHWPSAIEDGINAIKTASKVMFIFYCIGIGFAGLALIGAAWGFLANGRMSASVNFMLDLVSFRSLQALAFVLSIAIAALSLKFANIRQLAFLTLGIASAISTAVIVKAVDAVNKHGADIGIAAYKGSKFLGMTWAATALMLLASFVWIVEFLRGHRHGTYTEKGRY